MPSVDVTSLITGLNPIRQTNSYTMPVLSPRHGTSSTLTGSYRSTFSSSSIDRPYSNSYSSPRSYSYTERYTSRYTNDDGKKTFSRHSSITEDGVSRFRSSEEGREMSVKRDLTRSESGYRDNSSTRSGRDGSLTRIENSGLDTDIRNRFRDNEILNSRNELSTISVLDAVADIRSKYSPANYVPAVLRKTDSYSRSKSDIGKPPLELRNSEVKNVKLKKVNNENNTVISNGFNALTNQTNNLDNTTLTEVDDKNGNRTSVAEIRKKFDPNPNFTNRKSQTNGLYIEGIAIKPKTPNSTNFDKQNDTEQKNTTKSTNGRPPKCSKIITNLITQDPEEKIIKIEREREKSSEEKSKNIDIHEKLLENSSTKLSHSLALNNHVSNFPSYISSKEVVDKIDSEDQIPTDDNSKIENNTDTTAATAMNGVTVSVNVTENDLSTSPRLSGLQNNIPSSSNSTLNNILPSSRTSPITTRDDERSYDRSSVKNQGLNGLKNIGNTCFMNSVIQCLSNTRLLLEYVRGDSYMDDINTTISGMKGSLIKAFSQVIQELWSPDSSDRVVNTVALKSQIQRFAPRFMGYSQQDAQEFLRYLLEGLHEDVNRVTTKPTPIHTEIDEKLSDSQKSAEAWQRYLRMDNSRIVDIFVGQFKSTLRCTHCGHCSVTFDPFWDLSLPIPQRQGPLRLQQCLEHFTREETLDGDEKPTCSKCKERRKCTKSFSIQKFPKVLVIHLKRFSPTERFRGKLSVIIDFPLNGLDLSPYAANSGHTDCNYNLYAISNHSGTTYSGHYTAYCKHPYSNQWHEYNDSRVMSISAKNVVSSEGYVLFYELSGQHSHL